MFFDFVKLDFLCSQMDYYYYYFLILIGLFMYIGRDKTIEYMVGRRKVDRLLQISWKENCEA